ncbi:MAG: CHAT domain-containing protein [Planctomycetes bacterium]|nr:CHAT domain-containing protein [Planctomycetota bacterium]
MPTIRLPGSGPEEKWNTDDSALPRRLITAIKEMGTADQVQSLSQKLTKQRLAPLVKHLQGVKRLYVVGNNSMAGVPFELLTKDCAISYTLSGTQMLRHRERAVPTGSALLAMGDPVFGSTASKLKKQELPTGGLLALNILPDGMAAKNGIQVGDVLLSYASSELKSVDELIKLIETNANAKSTEIKIWRASEKNKTNSRNVPPGKVGIVFYKRPAREAVADRRKMDELLASRGPDLAELPGTRIELNNLAKLFEKNATVFADSDASEQKLEELRLKGDLSKFRYLHFGTHGAANNASAFESVLYLSQDKLPKELVSEPNSPFINGELSAREVLEYWKLDAELVTLSACETALGKTAGGDGLLGFAQAFLTAGARSVCLSLWKVDDTATALLMNRFYQNLLGKRDGLTKPMPKAEALREAKNWLRNLSSEDALTLTATMTNGVARGDRGKEVALKLVVPKEVKTDQPAKDSKPFSHPKFWAAFILIGDPN